MGDNMLRTQIRFEKQDYARIKKEAKALGVPIAELVRRAVRQSLPPPNQPPWMRYAGFVESPNARSSQLIDDIVYGSKAPISQDQFSVGVFSKWSTTR
jgi:hypothetical protein